MTDAAIDIPDNTLSQQVGASNIYIQNLLPVTISTKSSFDEKMKNIFEVLKTQSDITDNHRQIIERLIEACKCTTYTHTGFRSWLNRTVIKTSHTPDQTTVNTFGYQTIT
jgi:hypothetical protein